MEDISVYLGPGYWAVIHIESLKAKDYDSKCEISRSIARIISTFPCLKCRKHAIEYAKMNPFRNVINDDDELSLFKWVWKFHNDTNKRINKPIMSFEDALTKWSSQMGCEEANCIN